MITVSRSGAACSQGGMTSSRLPMGRRGKKLFQLSAQALLSICLGAAAVTMPVGNDAVSARDLDAAWAAPAAWR